MKLYFKNGDKEILLLESDSEDAINSKMKNFLEERDFPSRYWRHWMRESDGKRRVYTDFGSHTCFFIVESDC